ncbi:translesion error-prone DNA polymerase V autoproteolytic subunit [Herbaspirillum sp. ST 5-3]|uniref:LexA family protein n=1 Tax=Oxalobacteraceae TaxID=75682 RepID=UPI0010A2F0D4|nr:translesion error-prone DNA polymerase V autoproteolytic subunit [Herbaspirillum sp. ST 5-3]
MPLALTSPSPPLPGNLLPASEAPEAVCRPLFRSHVAAGFPSPASDYIERGLDLNSYLIRNKAATFFFRVKGDSMIGARIHDGDLLVVDRSIQAEHGHVVLAVVDGEYTVKRLNKRAGVIELHAENPDYPPIRFSDGQELQIWGVVIGTVCKFIG